MTVTVLKCLLWFRGANGGSDPTCPGHHKGEAGCWGRGRGRGTQGRQPAGAGGRPSKHRSFYGWRRQAVRNSLNITRYWFSKTSLYVLTLCVYLSEINYRIICLKAHYNSKRQLGFTIDKYRVHFQWQWTFSTWCQLFSGLEAQTAITRVNEQKHNNV